MSMVALALFGGTAACSPAPIIVLVDPVSRPGASADASGTVAAGDAPVFDVHEWGLLDVGPRGTRLVAGPPAGQTNWSAPRKKPVLYFHLANGSPPFVASVTVNVPAPGIVEQLPRGALSPDGGTLTWSGLRVRRESCPVTFVPKPGSPDCNASDGLCEAAQVASYQADDAGCIEAGGAAYNHLFYRADGPAPTLPFEISVQGNQVTITHSRANDLIGAILYVHNDGGVVGVRAVLAPPVGQSVSLSPPVGTDVAGARRSLDATMQQIGLTSAEIGAFDRAWTNDLFGEAAGKDIAKKAAAAPEDYLLFAMPASLVDGASRLTIRPAPRSVARFMLVRVRV